MAICVATSPSAISYLILKVSIRSSAISVLTQIKNPHLCF
ncbi:hypothetical protein LEP1GSC191_2590 [Leptospira borgpetersenii serovar Mini str. 201000851]|uniref:Lipoprotein n=1 Tax=Leptospira borgpetersenii str. 200801926 TaxID=1193009 RepID=A0ABN0HV79_LEPBO|nr:hypothetical protein LEP1GSC128_3541 [Leptospira borgpetersenii str. 200801926]EMK14594.1 hypothetical protein LEP1GSC066_3640 [Leptospira sp. serovar Kenya str. Sh9]ENO65298.1 hypothetical protein LEP1GSC191_2590 [Leptospira borgpetersenii serovar Mini str. 201000851]